MYPSSSSVERSADETLQLSKRTTRACDACYKRKIKCDAAVPRCNWCSHHNTPCLFERKIKRGRKVVSRVPDPGWFSYSSVICMKLTSLESLISQQRSQQNTQASSMISAIEGSDSPLSRTQSSVSSSVPLHFAGRKLGVISLFTGIPFLLPEGQEWVQSRTGERLAFDRFAPGRAPWERQRNFNSTTLLADFQPFQSRELPDRSIVEMELDIYRTSLMRRIFPVIDPVLFLDTIKAAYHQPHSNPSNNGQCSTKACIFAFAAFVIFVLAPGSNKERRDFPPLDGEACSVKAQYLVSQVLQENATLDGLQAVAMLALIELVAGNLQSADYYGSIAVRMIFMLGAHIYSDQPSWHPKSSHNPDSRVQTHLRNIFWLCYTLHQDVSLRTGQAQPFSEENCDLTLPPGYVDELYTSLAFHHHSAELPETPIFPMDLRLSIIKSRAYSALYSFRSRKKTDAEILQHIRELDDELERWRLSVPPQWRPTLSFSHETPDPNLSMHSVILRLNYHLCMTIIHQASSRCQSWRAGQAGIMDGVSSSLALSVEASRSTLLYLGTAEHVLADGAFWILIFYPMSALLAIFCNILQNPGDLQASKDLGLLRNATKMVERVFLRQAYSVNEMVHIKLVVEFVKELCRLATCAMDRAWSERARDGSGSGSGSGGSVAGGGVKWDTSIL
ncbi:hypothetical protein AOCH_001134 [Aspergillus ochraceoroseus]|uniref:Zn(2)-C6 fungal-type domain-containing protein n=1 Tax=Aspergillus ochraceoroseus TaxID=138278 RepID=A0A0F8VHV5_9EURO|nr:hypothetical protein AOCH_001134 [Aspergillus ochraceoroseus]